jgi:hypothetical protein
VLVLQTVPHETYDRVTVSTQHENYLSICFYVTYSDSDEVKEIIILERSPDRDKRSARGASPGRKIEISLCFS